MHSLTCLHTIYNNTNINTNNKDHQYHNYICTYPLQQHTQKKLVFKFRSLHVYIPSTKKIIKTKAHFQISWSYMCTYTLQQHKHKHSGSFKNTQFYMCTYPVQHHKKYFICQKLFYMCTNPQQQHKLKHKGYLQKY